jgi:hypothetical protein
MPDPKANAKLTGDTHLPDVESDLPVQGASGAGPQARTREQAAQARRGVRKAGVLTDRDSESPQDDSPQGGSPEGR